MKAKVMIVDDEIHTVRLVKRLLEREGYEVEFAYNGEEALKVLSGFAPDVMLLDIMMPGLPPKKVIEKLREMGVKVKIFYFSALTEKHETSDRIKRELVSDNDRDYIIGYIEKPFDNQDMLKRIKEAVEGSNG
ncbi:MAG: response regulator [Candidatus Altiarchaeota archaeon]